MSGSGPITAASALQLYEWTKVEMYDRDSTAEKEFCSCMDKEASPSELEISDFLHRILAFWGLCTVVHALAHSQPYYWLRRITCFATLLYQEEEGEVLPTCASCSIIPLHLTKRTPPEPPSEVSRMGVGS